MTDALEVNGGTCHKSDLAFLVACRATRPAVDALLRSERVFVPLGYETARDEFREKAENWDWWGPRTLSKSELKSPRPVKMQNSLRPQNVALEPKLEPKWLEPKWLRKREFSPHAPKVRAARRLVSMHRIGAWFQAPFSSFAAGIASKMRRTWHSGHVKLMHRYGAAYSTWPKKREFSRRADCDCRGQRPSTLTPKKLYRSQQPLRNIRTQAGTAPLRKLHITTQR